MQVKLRFTKHPAHECAGFLKKSKIKIAKTKDDKEQPENPIKVVINGYELLISPIESQIAYKFWLGSEKDIEDAVYLYELFRERLNKEALIKKCKELNVLETMLRYVK